MELVFAIGDIHGQYDHLMKMLNAIETIRAGGPATIVLIGDYVDRGPKSFQVVEHVRFMTEVQIPGLKVVALKGNHEDIMLNDRMCWLMNGGYQTIRSYGPEYEGKEETFRLPQDHRDLLDNLPTMYESDHYLFVHAGFRPGFEPEECPDVVRMWIRDEFRHSDYEWRKRVIHGHTPTKQIDIKPNRIGIDTGAVFWGNLTCAVLEGDMLPWFIQVSDDGKTVREFGPDGRTPR